MSDLKIDVDLIEWNSQTKEKKLYYINKLFSYGHPYAIQMAESFQNLEAMIQEEELEKNTIDFEKSFDFHEEEL